MKAAICYEFGKPLRIEEVEIDVPQQGEVKVRMVAAAICHSDVHAMRGEFKRTRLPGVLGHEAAGIVTEIGEGVTHTRPGDHVVVSLIRSCGRCLACAVGASSRCEGSFALDTQSRLRTKDGATLYHGLKTAAFAEYTII